MKSIITTNNHNVHSGFLNSNYKSIVKQNFKNLKANSVFSFKQRSKSHQLNSYCTIETVLKLSIFLAGIIVAFN